MWQFLHLFSFCIIQPLFKSIDYNFVDNLSLAIPLRIGRSGISVLYPQVRTVLPEGFTIELKAIIRDKGMGNPESSNDILLDKSFDIYISDISQRFSFNPLSKIIRADQQILFVS